MEPVTVEQVKTAVKEREIRLWTLRECSTCRTPLTYGFDGDDVTYDPSCGCVSYSNPPEPRTWESLADIFNRQVPEVRKHLWDRFLASGSVRGPRGEPL